MKQLFWFSFIVQSGLMSFDEFHYHWKRNLPKWERMGHPVDTFFFLLPLSIVAFTEKNEFWTGIYIGLSVLSCLIITKDEKIHHEKALPGEHWLHSLLFILHPVILISAFFLWAERGVPFLLIWGFVFSFFFYQLIFWNFYADRIFKTRR